MLAYRRTCMAPETERRSPAPDLHAKLFKACDYWPTRQDIVDAAAMYHAHSRDMRAYRAGICDDPRPNPAIVLMGVHGFVVVRDNGSMVFVPRAVVILANCHCDAVS